MKLIKRLSWSIIIFCCAVPLIIYALLATTTGSRWVVQQAIQYSQQNVQFDGLTGSLLGELQLSGLTITTAAATVTVNQLSIDWKPLELFEQKLVIQAIDLDTLQVTLQQAPDDATITSSEQAVVMAELPTLALPWPLTIDRLQLNNIRVIAGAQQLQFDQLQLQALWQQSQLQLREIQLDHQLLAADLSVTVDLTQRYPFAVNYQLASKPVADNPKIPAVTVTGAVTGNADQIALGAEVNLQDQKATVATVSATLENLQQQPSWTAHAKLTKLPVASFRPWLPALPTEVEELVETAVVDATVSLDPEQLSISDALVSQLGTQRLGNVELAGTIANYLQFETDPQQLQFTLDGVAQNLLLPVKLGDSTSNQLNIADISVHGSLELYSLAFGSHWTLMTTEDVNFSLAGIGTLNSLALSEITIAHDTFDAALTAQLGWLGTPWAAFNVTEFVGRVPLFEEDYELLLSGGFGFINGAISANNVEASINGTHLSANGALSAASELEVNLSIPNLENWIASHYANAEVELRTAISGDYLKQLVFSVDQLRLISAPFGQWLTQQASTITLSLADFNVAGTPLCLHEQRERNPASICVTPQMTAQDVVVNLDAKQLPLRLLNRFRETDVAERVWGNVDANAEIKLARSDGAIRALSGVFRSENTAITSLDTNLTSRLREWELSWNGNLDQITGTFLAYVSDDLGQILGDLTLTDVMAAQQLVGSLDLAINDLTLLQWLLPDLRYSGASAVANIDVSGSLDHPSFTGAVELVADEIGFAQSGLLLTKVRLALEDKLDATGLLTLQGQARSGSGWISLEGEIDLPKQELTLDIDGESFRAVELAMAQVDVSPDLQIKVANQRIDITGTVTVPYAQINEPDLTTTATVSNDVRLLLDGEPVTIEDDGLYPIYANIRVILSDQVAIDAYGFNGKVNGSIRLIEEPNRALRASGSIQVASGEYEIYGQELTIQRGVLIYNGGAIDNPGLDLRVVRTAASVSAGSDQITVGAQVGGTLLTPDFRLFSTPTMPDAEILSYLILGRGPGSGNSNNLQLQAMLLLGSQGTDLIAERLQSTFGFDDFGIDSTADPLDTSFYIGKYLSPKLYVKYGVGLFENTNTFYIRYLLTDKLIIESTTSTESQGGDILYTIEK